MIDTWEKIIDPNFISAEIIGDVGAERVVTITDIDFREAFDQKRNSKEQKQSLILKECKPMILNKTNAKMLRKLFGEDPRSCVGKKIVLYVTEVKVGGKPTTGIRIKEYSEVKCEACGNTILPIRGRGVDALVEISKRNTGKVLCLACMKKVKEEKEASANENI